MTDDRETFGDTGIATKDAPIPLFLKLTYILLPLWGLLTLYYFWDGSTSSWLDGRHWKALQEAAGTRPGE